MKLCNLWAGVPLKGEGLDQEMEINSISCEEEDIAPGTLYVELPGGLGAAEALKRGAAAAVCRQAPGGPGPYLTTEDPWQALALLAANWYCRPGGRLTLAAVAGGEEAEVTACLLKELLEGVPGAKVGLIAPDRAEIGTAELDRGARKPGGLGVQRLLLRMWDAGCTHVVLLLDREALARREYTGLRLSVTALTGPTGQSDALRGLCGQSDMVVFNLDERAWEDYGSTVGQNAFTYSENKDSADLVAKNLRLFPGHMEFEAVTVGQIQRIHLPVPGGLTLYHALSAMACGLCLGLGMEEMARVLRSARGPRGRLEVLKVPAAYTVVLDKARTPRELERLLVSAREFTAGRLICLLGCPDGEDAALHARMGCVAGELSDQIILTTHGGGNAHPMEVIGEILSGLGGWRRPCCLEPDRQTAVCRALEQAGPGDVIVLTGLARTSAAPDEREIVDAYFHRTHRRRERGAPALA